jgi:hypothetical protein
MLNLLISTVYCAGVLVLSTQICASEGFIKLKNDGRTELSIVKKGTGYNRQPEAQPDIEYYEINQFKVKFKDKIIELNNSLVKWKTIYTKLEAAPQDNGLITEERNARKEALVNSSRQGAQEATLLSLNKECLVSLEYVKELNSMLLENKKISEILFSINEYSL